MNATLRLFPYASALSLGLFAGAMLTEGLVLVPYWRSLPAAQFFSWYGAEGPRLLGFFGPLTWLAGLTALASALVALWTRAPGRGASTLAAGLMLAAVATFFLYFERANASFSTGSLDPAALSRELARWAHWHHARTGLGAGALIAALVALRAMPSAGSDVSLDSPVQATPRGVVARSAGR